MIRFEHVTRLYEPGGRPALDDVSVEFNRGDFVFLIGASGSGKSTLLRMILREGLPQKGKVTVAGQNLGLMLERRVPGFRRSIGMVFQDFRLLPDKTVFDNVAFAMRVIGAKRSQIRKRVEKVLKRVNLDHLAHRYPHEISGGEQQRAAIARAIVNEPAILLADEPTGNLDPRASDEVMKILRWVNSTGTTVIMATHDRSIVDKMSKRVVQLHQGKLIRDEAKGSYDPKPGSEAWEILVAEEQISGGFRASDPTPLRHDREDQSALDQPETAEDEAERQPGTSTSSTSSAAPTAEEPQSEKPQPKTGQDGNSDTAAEGPEASGAAPSGRTAGKEPTEQPGTDERRETTSEKTTRRQKSSRRKRKDAKKDAPSSKPSSARHGKPKASTQTDAELADRKRDSGHADLTPAVSAPAAPASIDSEPNELAGPFSDENASVNEATEVTDAAQAAEATTAGAAHHAGTAGGAQTENGSAKTPISPSDAAEGTPRARRQSAESLPADSPLDESSSAGPGIEDPDLEVDPSPKRALHQDPEGEEVVCRDEPQETALARDTSSAPEEQDPTPEFPPSAPESLRVTWPDHLHKDQGGATLPEPLRDFNGTELPDLDRDGYAEDEPAQEPTHSSVKERALDEDDTAEFPAATEDSPVEKSAAETAGPRPPAEADVTGSPDVDAAGESPDALEQAAATQPTTADNPQTVAPRPRLSWLAHADEEPVDKAVTGRSAEGVTARPAGGVSPDHTEERDSSPPAGGRAQHEPDIEDLRLAEQSADDEPPSEPQATPSEPVPGVPAEVRDTEAHDTEVHDTNDQGGEVQGTDARRAKPALPPEQRPVPEEITDEDFDVEPEADDLEDIDPPLENSLRETNPVPVPRPKTSASQSTWTDTKRTAEQLGVSGSQRSFWRRMKRRK